MAKVKISETIVSLRLSFDEMDKVKRIASQKNVSVSAIIRAQIKKIKN